MSVARDNKPNARSASIPASSAKPDTLHLLVSGKFGIIGVSSCGLVQTVFDYNFGTGIADNC